MRPALLSRHRLGVIANPPRGPLVASSTSISIAVEPTADTSTGGGVDDRSRTSPPAFTVVPLTVGHVDLASHFVDWRATSSTTTTVINQERAQQDDGRKKKAAMCVSPKELETLVARDHVLASQFHSMKAFATAPVHLARARTSHPSAVTNGTFWGYMKTFREFLGYCRIYEGVSLCDFDFRLCLDGPKLLRYVSFRVGVQRNKPSTITNQLSHFKAVMRWCLAELDGHILDSVETAQEVYSAIDALGKQVKDTTPPKHDLKVAELTTEGKWVEWPELRAGVDAFVHDTLRDVRRFRHNHAANDNDRSPIMMPMLSNNTSPRRTENDDEAASQDENYNATSLPPPLTAAQGDVMRAHSTTLQAISLASRLNTSLFGLIFCGGLNIGAPRPFLMKSLVLKGSKDGSGAICEPAIGSTHCSVCKNDDCHGNVLEKDARGDYTLVITHHKMGNKIKRAVPPISVRRATDQMAWSILDELFEWGHATLVDSYVIDDSNNNLMSPATTGGGDRLRAFRKSEDGAVFRVWDPQDNSPSMYVTKMAADVLGVPRNSLHLTANTLRRMYINWAKHGDDALTPEEEEGAALAMGTSVAMFNRVYDPTRRSSLVEQSRIKVRERLAARSTVGVRSLARITRAGSRASSSSALCGNRTTTTKVRRDARDLLTR